MQILKFIVSASGVLQFILIFKTSKLICPYFYRKSAFPYGLNHIYFRTNDVKVMLILTAPGNFYSRDRYFNEVVGDDNKDFSFTMRWFSMKSN